MYNFIFMQRKAEYCIYLPWADLFPDFSCFLLATHQEEKYKMLES